jgi:hypothetical protein
MHTSTASTPKDNPRVEWPLWHFAALEAAIDRGDIAAAAQAQRVLKRLGVTVRYGRHRRGQGVRRAH